MHAALMTVAWVFLLPLGALLARHRWGPWGLGWGTLLPHPLNHAMLAVGAGTVQGVLLARHRYGTGTVYPPPPHCPLWRLLMTLVRGGCCPPLPPPSARGVAVPQVGRPGGEGGRQGDLVPPPRQLSAGRHGRLHRRLRLVGWEGVRVYGGLI